jgi:hypothetical protein
MPKPVAFDLAKKAIIGIVIVTAGNLPEFNRTTAHADAAIVGTTEVILTIAPISQYSIDPPIFCSVIAFLKILPSLVTVA